MKSRMMFIIPLITFMVTFLIHGSYVLLTHTNPDVNECPAVRDNVTDPYFFDNYNSAKHTGFIYYLKNREYYLSLSYGLALSFTAFALISVRKNRRRGVAGVMGGLSLSAFIASVCFLIGCCGSPMLVVYLGLFGSKAFRLAKPLVAAVTFISVMIGYFLLIRKSKICSDSCRGD